MNPIESFRTETSITGGGKERSNIKIEHRYMNEMKRNHKGEIALLHAVRNYARDTVEALIKAGTNVNIQNERGKTPLSIAAKYNYIHIVEALIEADADVNAKDKLGRTPLHCALGYSDVTRALIKAGANVHIPNENGDTPLFIAAQMNYADNIVEALVEAGADVDAKDEDGWTALYFSLLCGHINVARVLLKAGANVNIPNKIGNTPLYTAAQKNYADNIVEALIEAGADVNAKHKYGGTALHVSVLCGHADVARDLIKAGANVNIPNESGETPLFIAAKKNYIDIVEALTKAGSDVDAKDKYGCTPLHISVFCRYTDVARALIKAGAKVNIPNINGETPLFFAAKKNDIAIVEALTGGDVDANDKYGQISFNYSVLRGDADVATPLVNADANVNIPDKSSEIPLLSVVACKYVDDIVDALIEAGADVDAKDPCGWTPLCISAFYGHVLIAKALIEKQANINAKTSSGPESHGDTALNLAVRRGHICVAELIVIHIAKLEALNLHVSQQNLQQKHEFIVSNNLFEYYDQHLKEFKMEVKNMEKENKPLSVFLKERDFTKSISIWEEDANIQFNLHFNKKLKKQYRTFFPFLKKKYNDVKKEIFLHNHKPLIDILSLYYRRNIHSMTFIGMKNFLEFHRDDFMKELGGNRALTLFSFVNFNDVKERWIPKLKVKAFAEKVKLICSV